MKYYILQMALDIMQGLNGMANLIMMVGQLLKKRVDLKV